MPARKKKRPAPNRIQQGFANIRRIQAQKDQGYRAQALKILPHICGRCGREFSGKQLSELTVHHKDGNHMNNPVDGSNWEMLCLYCHDDQHETRKADGHYEGAGLAYDEQKPDTGFRPFENLKDMLQKKQDKPDSE